MTEEDLSEYELTISKSEMPLHNTVVFSETGLKDKLDDVMWSIE
tara:strand:+ start:247 stop:378 length:132 start_codon:yes stop_codon:yes gene_type:complete